MKTKLTSILLLFMFYTQAQAQSQSTSDDWECLFAPYGLIASIEGEAGVGRAGVAEVAVDFSDILENLQLGGMFHGEIRKGSWGVILDLSFMNLGTSGTIPTGGVVRADVDQLMLESFLAYRKESRRGWIEIMGGMRTFDIDLQLELNGPVVQGTLIRGETWVDPLVGTRGLVKLSDRASLIGQVDIGGFGVGSDFSWNLQGGLGFDLTKRAVLFFQYRTLNVDFESGQAGTADFFKYDTNTHGPLFGLGLRF